MGVRVAYGKRSKITDAIAAGVIPKDSLIITNDAEESELYFYDAAGKMKRISERKQFETISEAQAWVKTYDCVDISFLCITALTGFPISLRATAL